jgi:TfoX/Sxy family transcriptional regulator of competence genes
MPYDEKLADRLRETLADIPKVEEKKMFRGVTFMVNGKMCISVSGDELMVRFDPEMQEEVLAKKGVRPMIMKNRTYNGYVYVDKAGLKNKKDFDYWIALALDFNKKAKASKKKTKKK